MTMEPDKRQELEELMATMATDKSAVVPFLQAFGDHLAVTVRWHLREIGRDDVAHDQSEFEGLVYDTAFFIADNAAAWKPEAGALPWTWAQRGLRNMIIGQIGQRVVRNAEDLDSEVSDLTISYVVDLGADDLETLAKSNPAVDLMLQMVFEVASPRDARVFLEYRRLKREGAPSPANTVAKALPQYRLSDANVRKIHSRVRRQVCERLTDPRYLPIADLPFWAA